MSAPVKIPTRKTVINTETGAVIEETTAHFTLMPVEDPHACPDCGRRHEPGQPHDAQSLHYQYTVYGRTGRWPTWKDAIAHCNDATRAAWEQELRRLGHWSEDAETSPDTRRQGHYRALSQSSRNYTVTTDLDRLTKTVEDALTPRLTGDAVDPRALAMRLLVALKTPSRHCLHAGGLEAIHHTFRALGSANERVEIGGDVLNVILDHILTEGGRTANALSNPTPSARPAIEAMVDGDRPTKAGWYVVESVEDATHRRVVQVLPIKGRLYVFDTDRTEAEPLSNYEDLFLSRLDLGTAAIA